MKVLVLSAIGNGLSIADKLTREGHAAEVFIKDERFKISGYGIVGLTNVWRSKIKEFDLIIGDAPVFGQYESMLKEVGKPYIGISAFGDTISNDERSCSDLLSRVGLQSPVTYDFTSSEDAKVLLDDFPASGVIVKHSIRGIEDVEDPYTYEWLIDSLPFDPDEGSYISVREVTSGVDVLCEGWFNGRDWAHPFNLAFHSIGTVLMSVQGPPIISATLDKLTPTLRAQSYKGPVTAACTVNASGVYTHAIGLGISHCTINAFMEGLKEDAFDLFFEVALGSKKQISMTRDLTISFPITAPLRPQYNIVENYLGLPITGISEHNRDHIYLVDTCIDGEGCYRFCCTNGIPLHISARGRDLKEARSRAYRTAKHIRLHKSTAPPFKIFDKVEDSIEQLRSWGYV